MSVEEYRELKASIEEELNDPSPVEYTVEEIEAELGKSGRSDAAAA